MAPGMCKPFKLQVGTSHVGAGGVLLQMDEFAIERLVSFFSKKFNGHQLNYLAIEKETLALIWSLKHFEVYVGSGLVTVSQSFDFLELNSLPKSETCKMVSVPAIFFLYLSYQRK